MISTYTLTSKVVVEKIENKEEHQEGQLVCRIELTSKETKSIVQSLMRTSCSGEHLDVSEELESKIFEISKKYN